MSRWKRLWHQYKNDIGYRVRLSLYLSLGINLSYVAFKFVSGIVYGVFWLDAFAVYYLILTLVRFLLLSHMHRNRNRQDQLAEFRRYRLCGLCMLILNFALFGIVALMLVQASVTDYHIAMIVAMVAYTVYALSVSIIDLIRYRVYERPLVSAAKSIRFTAALVSLLSIEATLLDNYGKSEVFRRGVIFMTGAGVCLCVTIMSILMIVRAQRAIMILRKDSMYKQQLHSDTITK